MSSTVTSATNPLVVRLRKLAERRHREQQGAMVVHGSQAVRQGVEAGAAPELLVVRADVELDADAARFVERVRAAGARVVPVAADVLSRVTGRAGPATFSAVFALPPPAALPVPPAPAATTIIALDRIANPGNLGTIVRSANAAGAAGVALCGPSADPFDPVALRAGMGAVFATPVQRFPDVTAFLDWAGAGGIEVVAATGHTEHGLWEIDLPARVALLLGQEGPGLDAADVARCQAAVAIPMRGTTESLNVAAAAAVLLYERYRRQAGARSAG